jgi:hypothetical protein
MVPPKAGKAPSMQFQEFWNTSSSATGTLKHISASCGIFNLKKGILF